MERANICPYKGCVKAYTSKTSLRFHTKRHHLPGEELKSVVEEPAKGPIKFRRGVNLKNVFKKEHLSKLESKLGCAHACSTEDYSNSTNSADAENFENYGNNLNSENLGEEQTSQSLCEKKGENLVLPEVQNYCGEQGELSLKKEDLEFSFPANERIILSPEDKELHKEIFCSQDKKSQVSTDCFDDNEISYHENFEDLGIVAKDLHGPVAEKNTFYDMQDDLVFYDTTMEKEHQKDTVQDLFAEHHDRSFSMYEDRFGELDRAWNDNLTKISLHRPISLSFDYY